MSAAQVIRSLRALANKNTARDLEWFFKTGPGEYGEGDRFLGIKVPQSRAVAREYRNLDRVEIHELVQSEFHEVRFCALVILTNQFEKAKGAARQELFDYYLSLYDLGVVNNWDLVDVTANRFGKQLIADPGAIEFLLDLAGSENLWKQRLAVILTFPLIAEYDFAPTMVVCEELVDHPHDLINKAVGWALRVVGQKDLRELRRFLEAHAATMPRVALRYAIEKLSEKERADWLSRKAQAQLERGR